MGRIKEGKYQSRVESKTVLLSVQQREGERSGSTVIIVDDLDDASEIYGADSLELFKIEFKMVEGSIERVSDTTKKCQ